jgi:hypothetical protein
MACTHPYFFSPCDGKQLVAEIVNYRRSRFAALAGAEDCDFHDRKTCDMHGRRRARGVRENNFAWELSEQVREDSLLAQ